MQKCLKFSSLDSHSILHFSKFQSLLVFCHLFFSLQSLYCSECLEKCQVLMILWHFIVDLNYFRLFASESISTLPRCFAFFTALFNLINSIWNHGVFFRVFLFYFHIFFIYFCSFQNNSKLMSPSLNEKFHVHELLIFATKWVMRL